MKRITSMKGRADDAEAPGVVAPSVPAGDADSAFDSILRKIAHVSHMSAASPLPRVGQVIGEKYRIEARLGRGGMGVVYRATHLVSQKAVALKWMLRSTTDGSAHRRLQREALAAGRIDHPNVVNVYDVGQEGECAYLVMELLHGESLRARLDRGRLGSAEAIDLLLPALRGVSAAHRAGVIHRDLKPDNIFLCTDPDGSAREAKVLDFGVSAVTVQSPMHPTLTDGSTILGTPAYMSPEQLVSSQDADERTDVYAFGVMLYEALTGRLPFVADSYSGLVLAVATELPTAPSEVRSDIPPELERVILQVLSKERRDRPQSIDALHELLAPFGGAGRHAVLPRGAAPPRAPAWRAWSDRYREAAGQSGPSPGSVRSSGLLVPDELFASRYRVRRCIAEGGRGATFEAEHVTTERRVALKLFPHMLSVGDARKKFELEAKISARVKSPFIVEVLDAGYDEATELPFLVMELLEGQTLAEWILREGPLDADPALRLLEQVASGLDAAHAHREPGGAVKPIVHRDLKPENLFLARQHDGSIVAKILGYGVAKVLGEPGTVARELRGTPLYMSFEQITGRTVVSQTDVWALGLVAFYMLTGARYWTAGYGERSSVQSLFSEILSSPRKVPSERLREQGSSVELPPAFDAWMLRCIDRDPLQRFASAGEAVRALAQVFEAAPRTSSGAAPLPVGDGVQTVYELDGAPESVSAILASSKRRTRRQVKRRPSALGRALREAPMRWVVAGAAGGGLLLGAVGWLVASDRDAPSGTSVDASGIALPSLGVNAAQHPPSALTGAALESEGRLHVESAALAAPRADDALEDWLPAEPPSVLPAELPSEELDLAEVSPHSRKSRARREPFEKEGSVAVGASTAPPRSRKERARTGDARPERSAGNLAETLPEPGLAEAYKTR